MSYFVIKINRDLDGAAQIEGHPEEVKSLIKSYKFRKAISLKESFLELPGYHFSDEYPDNRLLTDFQDNTNELLVLSEKFSNILRSYNKDNLELLAIKLINHKGKVASDSYYICNIVGTLDCLDYEQSDFTLDAMDS